LNSLKKKKKQNKKKKKKKRRQNVIPATFEGLLHTCENNRDICLSLSFPSHVMMIDEASDFIRVC
jgi:transcription initiation factor TFIIIB Brf1 subunit/transcription initiation factor TFIIB